jgi:hypothetical protein
MRPDVANRIRQVADDVLLCVREQAERFAFLANVCETLVTFDALQPADEKHELAECARRYRSCAQVLRAFIESLSHG